MRENKVKESEKERARRSKRERSPLIHSHPHNSHLIANTHGLDGRESELIPASRHLALFNEWAVICRLQPHLMPDSVRLWGSQSLDFLRQTRSMESCWGMIGSVIPLTNSCLLTSWELLYIQSPNNFYCQHRGPRHLMYEQKVFSRISSFLIFSCLSLFRSFFFLSFSLLLFSLFPSLSLSFSPHRVWSERLTLTYTPVHPQHMLQCSTLFSIEARPWNIETMDWINKKTNHSLKRGEDHTHTHTHLKTLKLDIYIKILDTRFIKNFQHLNAITVVSVIMNNILYTACNMM